MADRNADNQRIADEAMALANGREQRDAYRLATRLQVRSLQRALQAAEAIYELEMDRILREHELGDFRQIFGYRVGRTWDCEHSPIGCCIYDHLEDPPHDFCLFCHEPAERK